MFRKALILVSLSPSLALAVSCPGTPTAALPASLPVPEMANPAFAPARDCGPADATAWLLRLRQPAPAPARAPASAPAAPANGGYVPKTAHDNTPWRFDMNQNGRRMTAEEFDAWMKAKGIRVATGKPAAAAAPADGATAAGEQAGE